jgi:Mlc titration factor MtfA (ptsG expression regulator)
VIALFTAYFFHLKQKRSTKRQPLTNSFRELMLEHVEFYKKLNQEKRKEFEDRVELFLAHTQITGVKTEVEELDKVLIASSAVIPIFGFPGWHYVNLKEVLLYPDSFNHEFEQTGYDRNILGMVGTGALNRVMILSQNEIRAAFLNKSGKTNTAIHEFVHLVDKMDGATDGLPEFIAQRQYIVPWLQLMRREMQNILSANSDINPYGATNEAEFFAVVSEYFFEQPAMLEEKNPDLYKFLS